LLYFQYFKYAPTFTEVYTFLKKKTSQKHLKEVLNKMIKKGLVKTNSQLSSIIHHPSSIINHLTSTNIRYTLGEYSIKHKNAVQISQKKIEKIQMYTTLLSYFPHFQLVGLSGTVAMMNAKENDDIDLFVIATKNVMWTARFFSILFAQLFGLRRKVGQTEVADKVCLNLFIDEQNLKVPKFKQTEYVAHEILQMKPIFEKNDVYIRFIKANKWVFDIFPNALMSLRATTRDVYPVIKLQGSNLNTVTNKKINLFGKLLESILKHLQLFLINRHKTTEIITDTQLWFFPDDFEKKLQGSDIINKK
ncbi:MAG: hypothetical protein Q7R95_02200, partial [bacterium]|nr:hypothetical protein [bacterium]